MTISIDQFVKKYDGKAVDFDKAYGAQCVDLFNFYNSEVVGAPWIGTPITGGARDLWENAKGAPSKHYRRLAVGAQILRGDVLVYGEPLGRAVVKGRTIFFGHVRIALGGGRTIEQNGRISQRTTIQPLSTSGMIGILRPIKFEPKNAPQTTPAPTQNKNKHTIISGDTFWGLEERYGLKHGTLQKANPTLDPKRLRIGEVINLTPRTDERPAPAAQYYNIKSGDTFWDLENAWQLPHGRLQQLNPGVQPRALQIGQRIRKS